MNQSEYRMNFLGSIIFEFIICLNEPIFNRYVNGPWIDVMKRLMDMSQLTASFLSNNPDNITTLHIRSSYFGHLNPERKLKAIVAFFFSQQKYVPISSVHPRNRWFLSQFQFWIFSQLSASLAVNHSIRCLALATKCIVLSSSCFLPLW